LANKSKSGKTKKNSGTKTKKDPVKTLKKKQVKTDTVKKTKEKITKKQELKTSKKDSKTKSLSSRLKIMIAIFVIIMVCIVGLFWFMQSSNIVKAQLIIDYGDIQVKHEGGSWISAQNGMDLLQSDSIRTGDNASASIVFFKSSIIRLDSNTEVNLQEMIQNADGANVKINQNAGRTWNSISKISGIDNFEVQTPTTVASVRGTAFVVIVDTNGTTYYGVEHGVLNVSSISDGKIQDVIDVSGNESVIVFIDLVSESLEVKPFERDDWVDENIIQDDEFRGDVKEELYSRIEQYIPEIKELYGISDEELDVLLEGYLLGYYDLPPETPGWIRDIIELS
jgi:hypothetical protein